MKQNYVTGILLLILLPCFPAFSFAQSYAHLIDYSKIIIQFEKDLSENEKRQQLSDIEGLTDHLVFLPSPEIVIAFTKNITSSSAYHTLVGKCKHVSTVTFVGPYLKNEEGHGFGVLNEVFVQLKKPDDYFKLVEPFIKQRLKIPRISISPILDNLYIIKTGKSGIAALDLAIKLNKSGDFVFAEPNYLVNPVVAMNDPLIPQQWAIDNLGTLQQGSGTPGADMAVRPAWEITTGDPNIKVAVMDSGVDTNHIDLIDNLLPGYDAFGAGTNGYPTPIFPQDGHGTACAGIIAAKGNNGLGLAGVAYDVSLIPVRIFFYADTSFMGVSLGVIPFSTSEVLAAGTQWAWQNGADIQSHSWSLPDLFLDAGILPGNPALVEMAIADSAAMGRDGKGCLLFFSSGNEDDPPFWPGRLPDAMTVNATSMCDEAKTPSSCDGQNWTGNWGAELDFGAPGVRVYTTDMMWTNGFNSSNFNCCFNGTSAACPNAAGVAALLLSFDPTLTLPETREILSRSCEKVGGYAYDSLAVYGTWTPELGYGRLNAYQALLEAGADPVNVEAPIADEDLLIFPNPASDRIFVTWHGVERIKKLSVFNLLGQMVIQSNSHEVLDIAGISNGAYFLEVRFDDRRSIVRKVVVSR